jgi:hypothetical protein
VGFEWSDADVPIVAAGLQDYDIGVRRESVELLNRMRPLSRSAAAELERAGHDWMSSFPGVGEQVWLSYSRSEGGLGVIARTPRHPPLREAVLQLLADLGSGR